MAATKDQALDDLQRRMDEMEARMKAFEAVPVDLANQFTERISALESQIKDMGSRVEEHRNTQDQRRAEIAEMREKRLAQANERRNNPNARLRTNPEAGKASAAAPRIPAPVATAKRGSDEGKNRRSAQEMRRRIFDSRQPKEGQTKR